ncbi:uncharacterized protein [Ptychodera flava]|uniref:uncharacterized protein n=1 Tax=Ptychodera flava TaxID=63121 RepID=UPI003969FA6A
MDVAMKTLVFAFLLTFVIERSSAVECYTCTSVSTADSDTCANPVDGTTLTTTCAGECQTTFTYLSNSITSVTRACVLTCIESDPMSGLGGDTDCCSTDKCNSESVSSQGDGDGDDGDSCYSCTWPLEDNCKIPDDTTRTCSGSKCSKTTVHNGDDLTSVTRACNAACSTSDIDFFGVKTETACCEGDKCNNAVYSVVSFVALFMSFIAAIYHTAL